MYLYIAIPPPDVTRKEILFFGAFLFFIDQIIYRFLCKIQLIMIHAIFTIIAAALLSFTSADKPVILGPAVIVSSTPSEQNIFQVIALYRNGYQTYKAKLKLKLVSSMYGQNSYMAVEYATDQLQNGQWLWHSCSASCSYDAINHQYSVFINGTTFYFDDPLE